MVLDVTTKEVNIRGSIQKYFVDSLETAEGKNIIVSADLESVRNLTEWIHLNFMDRNDGNKLLYELQLVPATREDDEGYTLAALEDLIDKYLFDSTGKRVIISFYDISALPNLNEIGKIHLFPQPRGPIMIGADDRTKFRIIPVIARISIKLVTN